MRHAHLILLPIGQHPLVLMTGPNWHNASLARRQYIGTRRINQRRRRLRYPYGIYDIGRNTGFVNVGTDHDTGAFAVVSIRGWWRAKGRALYPQATELLSSQPTGWKQRVSAASLEGGSAKAGRRNLDVGVRESLPARHE